MADPIRQALERLLAVIKPKYTDPDEIVAVVRAMAAARTALAAEPPAPAEPSDFQALQGIALDMVESLRPIVLPEILGVLRRAIKQAPAPAEPDTDAVLTLAHLRRCPAHGQLPVNALGCPECLRELREELARLRGSAADGEREELAQWLEDEAVYYEGLSTEASAKATRAAALLREARPQPVPVAERPWKRPGWRDAEGRCWWGRCADDFFNPEWTMATLANIEEFCSDAMPQHCLPHWAIPQPPQVNTTHPIPTEPPTDD